MTYRLAADVGGTFTDIVRLDEATGACLATKVPTTPDDIAVGVVRGFDEIVDGDYTGVTGIVYGTTAGLNALIQRGGARTALVTTRGFRDVYEIGRGNHPDMYDNQYRKPVPLLGRRDVVEVGERTDRHGTVVTPVDPDELREVAGRLAAGGYASVAVAFLHAYVNPANERAAAEALRAALPAAVPVTASSDIAPELGEYERVSTTVMNAYITPVIRGYVTRLRQLLTDRGFGGEVFVMQSNGGVLTERVAAAQPVRIVMSGPVGGVIGAGAVGAGLGTGHVLAVDMGGTSFDVSLIVDGAPQIALESQLEGFPVLVPSVQTLSVGAGGGSVAWTEAGSMRVGPRSSGARPGPVCYRLGGREPTTTDANVVLGRIAPEHFLGGRMAISPDLAAEALAAYGAPLGLTATEAAEGVLTITNSAMADAIRQITLRRGLDARDFTLLAYGGAGPLHAVALAEELEIDRVVVPPRPGAFSAWGMLHAPLRHDGAASLLRPLDAVTPAALDDAFAAVRADLDPDLVATIEAAGPVVERRSLDLRYRGQKYSVNLALDGLGGVRAIRTAFDERYRVLFGFASPDTPVEVVNARLALVAKRAHTEPPATEPPAPLTARARQVIEGVYDGRRHEIAVVARAGLAVGDTVPGPAVLAELTATTVVPPGWRAVVDADGSLTLTRAPADPAHPDRNRT
ncbi:hydantoinase/oxoprolinase family protein [Streptomyces radicis]|uniref:Hydantoinase/oxoprolinase family protein n=1 Tax=Streptomyces radicis TaxID=1750517 RepID=A0A3A9WJQ5_9ACTN|nr:hydantoinase/oxoprolinase family protein [Streptomyces radicis]RKN12832.1 hydantoinase/oxoprolinase family protein [Streptomyces radicis]RKN27403.1 hydantoinase/oxoprolinase family protein [Streptomyces radicis]